MAANILVQFILTPFYLKYLGDQQFGLLMVILNLINFTAIGINWMSAGFVRVIGEYWEKSDLDGFRNVFTVGKYVFTLYALFMLVIGIISLSVLEKSGTSKILFSGTVLLAGLYLLLNYEALPERQAYIGTNQQAKGNQIEIIRTLTFAGLIFLLLPQLKNMSAIWISLMCGVLLQRIVTSRYWKRHVRDTGWKKFTPEMQPILKRLAGKQGFGYVSYGALLLILQADTMVVGLVGGAEAAGQFVLLWKIPESIGLLLWKIPATLEPRVIQMDASGDHKSMYRMFFEGRRWFFMLVISIALIYIAIGHWLAELWVGEHAPDEEWMYMAGGVALFFSAFARWPIAFAHATIKLRALVKVATIEVLFRIIFIILFFQYFSIAAPILATIIIHLIYASYAYQRVFLKEVGI